MFTQSFHIRAGGDLNEARYASTSESGEWSLRMSKCLHLENLRAKATTRVAFTAK
jgi:hypothetical protein